MFYKTHKKKKNKVKGETDMAVIFRTFEIIKCDWKHIKKLHAMQLSIH